MVFESEDNWRRYITSLKDIKKETDKETIKNALINAIEKSTPNQRFGILFSGGIDSTFIALVCKQLKKDFICYCVGIENSEDLVESQKVAKALDLKLESKLYSLDEAKTILKETTKLLGEADVMKVGVASVVYAAMSLAKKDKITHFFSGLGSEEIFAGYQRHERSKDINEECWTGLFNMYKRDIERDSKISANFNSNILIPFLDKDVISNAMNLPASEKIKGIHNKYILREIAIDLGLKEEFAMRKKRAAQYGSKFDRAILRLAKRNGLKYKKDYLKGFL
jgi:asparagine synthetase B (glutamine-hydrolysing)